MVAMSSLLIQIAHSSSFFSYFQENLLLSIIPKHMARKVRNSIWSHLEKTKNRDIGRAPFK